MASSSRRRPASMVVLLLPLAGAALHAETPGPPPAGAPPDDVVSGFHEAYRKSGGSGLPDPALDAWCSSRLRALLKAARSEQERFALANPDEKPPWIEGDLFSSLFEGATSSEAQPPDVKGDRALVRVKFRYEDASAGPPVAWEDLFTVVKEEGAWRVDDVEYGGSWDFASHGRLSDSLKP